MREIRNRRPREDIMRDLVERSDSLEVCFEQGFVKSVKEFCPEVKLCTLRTTLGGNAKGLLFQDGRFYDIEEYVKLYQKLDREAIEQGVYNAWISDKIWNEITMKILEDLKAGRLKEWADAWVMYENSPLIA